MKGDVQGAFTVPGFLETGVGVGVALLRCLLLWIICRSCGWRYVGSDEGRALMVSFDWIKWIASRMG